MANLPKYRKQVLGYFASLEHPVSVEELMRGLRNQGVDIHVATLYRNLDILVRDRKLEVHRLNGIKMYTLSSEHTHYLECVRCKTAFTLGSHDKVLEKNLEEIESFLTKKHDFTNLHHNLKFEGLCKECN